MKRNISKSIAIILTFCIAFSGLPFLAGSLDVHAASKKVAKKVTLQAAASGQDTVVLKWNKIKKPQKGYAVFRDGTPIAHVGKKLTFTDTGLQAGSSHTYQIKLYKTKKVKMWYNKATGNWQKKKPAKKNRGKSKKVTTYTYQKPSNAVSVTTEPAPQSSDTEPTDTETPEEGTDASTSSITITWKNWDGTTLKTDSVEKGKMPSYTGTPTRPEDSNYIYNFNGWSPSIVAATANATYTAQYTATPKPAGTTYYTITWKNWDGSTLKTDSVEKGKTPSYSGTPTRPADSSYTYTFNGWSPSIVAATANATYTAQYTATAKPTYYTITWKNWDGSTLKTTTVQEGATPSYGGTPTRPADSFTYTFKGWSPSIVAATRNATYTAEYTPKSKYNYNIKFISEPYGNGGKSVYFIETNNTNPYSITANIVDSNGNDVSGLGMGISSSFRDVQFTDEDEFYVGNGIPMVQAPTKAGNLTFKIYEENPDTGMKITVYSKTVKVKDYAAEKIAWRQRVIQNVCTNSMTNQEKMHAICGYILTNFKYPKVDSSGYVMLLQDAGTPYWVRKEIDSALSPQTLADFGSDLGYPLTNMYPIYAPGTAEWTQYHMYAYSEADDIYFQACPDKSTGMINSSDIVMFDPNTYQFWGE